MLSPIEFLALVGGAAIGRLHDRRTSARADDEMAPAFGIHFLAARKPGKRPRLVIIFRLGLEPLGDPALVVGRRGRDQGVGRFRLGDPRRSVEDHRRSDPRLVEKQFWLEQLELEPDRPQILPEQEIHVLECEPVGGIGGLRGGSGLVRRLCFLARGLEYPLGRYDVGHPASITAGIERASAFVSVPRRTPESICRVRWPP